MFDLLPTEIIWRIMQALDPVDLSTTRLVCKKLRTLSDHPILWRDVQLKPSSKNTENLSLWNLIALKSVLQLHLAHIQTIQIWGVRDNIVRYILLNCHNLQELTISGWSTLSDHAFKIAATPALNGHHHHHQTSLNLRRLRLIGHRKSNYTSLDAFTFGKLLKQCPYLEEITAVRCQMHVQAECFLGIIVDQEGPVSVSMQIHGHQQPIPSSLKSLVVATKRTWSSHHVTRLFQLCSNLRFLGLVPDSTEIVDYTGINNGEMTVSIPVLDHSADNARNQPQLVTKNIRALKDHEMLDSDNLIVYKSNPFHDNN